MSDAILNTRFGLALKFVLLQEGGNDDDPHDPGGRTSRGIIQREYNIWRRRQGLLIRDVWSAGDDEVAQIYRENYWDPIHGDNLPAGVDLIMFDSSVNSGVSQAVKWLQRSLNVVADGVFGAHTFTALTDERDLSGLISEIAARRLDMDQHLAGWRYYKNGWAARIVAASGLSLRWLKGDMS